MTNSTPAGIVIEYDNSGGTLVDITQHVKTINDFNVEQLIENARTFGDSWEEFKSIGIGKIDAIEMTGDYDDTASTGPNALFGGRIPEGPATATRTLKITWLSGKTSSVETVLMRYKRSPQRDALTKYSVGLQPSGAVTEV